MSTPEVKKTLSVESKEASASSSKTGTTPVFRIDEILTKAGRSLFDKISDSGKAVVHGLYEGAYKSPGINRLVGKMEIAYNQFRGDKYEKKAAKFKNKLDGVDIKINAFQQAKENLAGVIKDLKQQNIPAATALELKIKDIEKQINKLANKRDRIQTKFEEKESRRNLRINKRDQIANRLIEYYENKLEPFERKLEDLRKEQDHIDLLMMATEVKHKNREATLEKLQKKLDFTIENYKRLGMSERKIRKDEAVKAFNEQIANARKEMQLENKKLQLAKDKLDTKIAKVDAKANPYRDRREEFVRVTKVRPIEFNVPGREKGQPHEGKEEIKTHERKESEVKKTESASKVEGKIETAFEEEEEKEKFPVAAYLATLNDYLLKNYDKTYVINKKDYYAQTQLSRYDKMEVADFRRILLQYAKFKRMPTQKVDIYEKAINNLFEKNK